ncbi:MAG: fibronectin type III domain-containing protein, partial [Acidimicrobiales bacterium]
GAFDADPGKFLVTTGSESGSTASGIVLQGGTFEDSLSAGGGTFTTGGGITLSGADLPSPEVPGVPSGQTLDILNQNAGNDVTTFTDSGTINITSNGGTAYIQNGGATDGLTVASGGQLNLSAATGAIAYVGYVGSLTIDSGANLTVTGPGTGEFWNAVSVVNNGTITVHDNTTLSIGDNFTQGEFGTLAVTSDTTAGTKSQITGGTDTLDGTLEVTTIGTPATYSPISSASSRTGYFGTLNYNGISYTTAYSSSAVTLTPSSSGYGLAGLTLSSTSVGATGVTYGIDLQGQAITAGSTTFTITAPAGTTFPTYSSNCYAVVFEDVTTSTSDTCLAAIPTTSGGGTTLTFTAPISIPATDHAQLQILDVTNSGPAASDSLTVSNGSASVQLGYTLTPSTSVANAAISASSTSDGASDVVYTTTFTATNGLTADGGGHAFSTITLTFPSTYTAPTYTSNCNQVVIYDLTTSTSETCTNASPSTSGQSVTYGVPIAINPGDQVKVVWSGITNPASSTGPQTFTLATSADPTPVDLSVDLTSPTSVTSPFLSAGSTSDSATDVLYAANFHSVNELVGGYSTVTLTLPAGYTPPTYNSNCNEVTILDITTAASENCLSSAPTVSGQSITFQVPPSVTINPGDNVSVAWYGLANPTSGTGSQTFQLSTSADPASVNLPVSLTSETGVSALTMTPSTSTAGASNVTYTSTFTAQNQLVPNADASVNSTISVTFPAGTGLSFTSNCNGVVIDDLTTSTTQTCTSSTPTLSNGNLTVTYLVPIQVNAGDHVQLTINGVTNPSTTSCTGSQSASLVTTSDPLSESATYAITSAPGAPTLNTATGGNGQVALGWTAPGCSDGSPINGYDILRSTTSGTETVVHSGVSGTTYTDTGLTNGTTYFYEVEAVNGVGPSVASNEKSATPATNPGAPTLNTATGGNNQVVLGWTAPSNNGGSGVISYDILRSTTSGTETLLATGVTALTYTDSTVV